MVHIIIFTKDRACQLDLLTQSIDRFLNKDQFVLSLVMETGIDFEIATKAQVNSDCEYTMFLPDDCMFIRKVDFEFLKEDFIKEMLCFSLRLGTNITYDLPLSKYISPKIILNKYGKIGWNWKDNKNQGYYDYPMSIDGHLFRTKEISEIINKLYFSNPNELETLLSRDPINHDYMASFDKSCLINLVLNRVQTTHLNNKSGNFTTEYLQARYDQGNRLDLNEMIKSVANANACHVIPDKLYWKEENK